MDKRLEHPDKFYRCECGLIVSHFTKDQHESGKRHNKRLNKKDKKE